jgi:L-lysine exporter family protein LysE/ArgO
MALPFTTFTAGMALSLSLIMAIGPQNLHVLRMGMRRQHLWLTVLTCVLADVVLIALGVFGLSHLGGLSDRLQGALVGAGVLFLATYGWQAFRRFRCPDPSPPGGDGGAARGTPATARQAIAWALAFSWLNPHAWLDTAVIIGSAALAWGRQGSTVFGLGAATGSAVWFVLLGAAALWLGRRLNDLRVWRVIDGLVALMMWGTAALLAASLFD